MLHAGMWYFEFDEDSALITNLWFARQLPADEVYRKLQNPPKQIAEKGFDTEKLKVCHYNIKSGLTGTVYLTPSQSHPHSEQVQRPPVI